MIPSPHSGRRVVEPWQMELAEGQQKHGDTGHDNLRPLRTDTRDLLSRFQVAACGNVPGRTWSLAARSQPETIRRFALGSRNLVHGAYYSSGGSRGRDGAIVRLLAELAHYVHDALFDVFFQAMELARSGWIVLEKYFGQAQCAERFRKALRHAAVLAQDQFGAAAADIDREDALSRMRPSGSARRGESAGPPPGRK